MIGSELFLVLMLGTIGVAGLVLGIHRWQRARRPDYLTLVPAAGVANGTESIPRPIRLGAPRTLAAKVPHRLANGRRMRRGRRLVMPSLHQPMWYAKGWRKAPGRDEYTGHYSIAGQRWRGLVKRLRGNHYRTYIWHPPMPQIQRNTVHSACFSERLDDRSIIDTEGCYRVHYHDKPGSLDHAIVSVELVLAEALNVQV